MEKQETIEVQENISRSSNRLYDDGREKYVHDAPLPELVFDTDKDKTINQKQFLNEIRDVLNKIPNRNSLYRDLGLNFAYQPLKRFINGSEEDLKKKGEEYLNHKVKAKKLELYYNPEELTDEEVRVIRKIQDRYLERLDNYASQFADEQRKMSIDQITPELKSDMDDALHKLLSINHEYNEDEEVYIKI